MSPLPSPSPRASPRERAGPLGQHRRPALALLESSDSQTTRNGRLKITYSPLAVSDNPDAAASGGVLRGAPGVSRAPRDPSRSLLI